MGTCVHRDARGGTGVPTVTLCVARHDFGAVAADGQVQGATVILRVCESASPRPYGARGLRGYCQLQYSQISTYLLQTSISEFYIYKLY